MGFTVRVLQDFYPPQLTDIECMLTYLSRGPPMGLPEHSTETATNTVQRELSNFYYSPRTCIVWHSRPFAILTKGRDYNYILTPPPFSARAVYANI